MALKAKQKKHPSGTGHHPVHKKAGKSKASTDDKQAMMMEKTLNSTVNSAGDMKSGLDEVKSIPDAVEHPDMVAKPNGSMPAEQEVVKPVPVPEETQVPMVVQPPDMSGDAGKTVVEAPMTEMSPIIESLDQTAGMVSEEASPTKWVAVIVVLGLLIVAGAGGAFYYLTQYKYAPPTVILSPQPDNTTDQAPEASDSGKGASQSDSDEVEAISKDLESTDVTGLDQEMVAIDKELP